MDRNGRSSSSSSTIGRKEPSNIMSYCQYGRPSAVPPLLSPELLGCFSWPPRSYSCSFCKREFRSAQALGGHMNVHRREKARLRHCNPNPNSNLLVGQISSTTSCASLHHPILPINLNIPPVLVQLPAYNCSTPKGVIFPVACTFPLSSSSSYSRDHDDADHHHMIKSTTSGVLKGFCGVKEVIDQFSEDDRRNGLEIKGSEICFEENNLDLELRLGYID